MILWVIENFVSSEEVSGALNIFRYITFRSVLAALLSFLLVAYLMPYFIRFMRTGAIGQQVRDDGPETHFAKKGTPTMGGLLIVGSVCLVSFLFCRWQHMGVWTVLFCFLSTALLGFFDDYLKLAKKNSKGVSFRTKMIVLSTISVVTVWMALHLVEMDPLIRFPFFKNLEVSIGPLFYFWGFLVIVGSSNAVNLTDGLDGLAIVPVMTTALVVLVLCYVVGHFSFSRYLQYEYLAGAGEISVIMASAIGAGLGFLWYNSHPAEVFMGDVGSLSLGSLLASSSLLIHQELLLFIAGFLFVMEALSVMIQVGFYKRTKRRVFKMAPLHHHFELSGWPEPKVIVRFWILSIIFALAALSTLKIR